MYWSHRNCKTFIEIWMYNYSKKKFLNHTFVRYSKYNVTHKVYFNDGKIIRGGVAFYNIFTLGKLLKISSY